MLLFSSYMMESMMESVAVWVREYPGESRLYVL